MQGRCQGQSRRRTPTAKRAVAEAQAGGTEGPQETLMMNEFQLRGKEPRSSLPLQSNEGDESVHTRWRLSQGRIRPQAEASMGARGGRPSGSWPTHADQSKRPPNQQQQ